MPQSLIQCQDLGFSVPHKTCFQAFKATLYAGDRVAIMGRNGSGKSSLLAMLAGTLLPSEGNIVISAGVRIALVPQLIMDNTSLSGAERFHAALTSALSKNPDVLLLDEPTNHLDRRNRAALLRMLSSFYGTLIIASHDVELLRQQVNTFWYIDSGKISIFTGQYDDYQRELNQKWTSIEQSLSLLKRKQQQLHKDLMQEQERAKQSRRKGEKHIKQRKWPTVVSAAKAGRAETTTGQRRRDMDEKKHEISQQLAQMHIPEVIKPNFSLTSADIGNQTIVSITNGVIGHQTPLVSRIHLQIAVGERVVIIGDNASGKSTLLKAVLGVKRFRCQGYWNTPKMTDIGYLDQHYQEIPADNSVLTALHAAMPKASHAELRLHLNRFLFRKNTEVEARVSCLSGGERARLSLAIIAAKTPRLLVLDEITNNLDLETRAHVIQVLQAYPGAMMLCSHDEDFLINLGVTHGYRIHQGLLVDDTSFLAS